MKKQRDVLWVVESLNRLWNVWQILSDGYCTCRQEAREHARAIKAEYPMFRLRIRKFVPEEKRG